MKLALCIEYPIDQFGGTEVLVGELIKGLVSEHQIVLVSNDTAESAKKSSVGHLISEHIPWDPAKISSQRSAQLAQALVRSHVDLVHFHLGGNFAWNVRAYFKSPIVAVAQAGLRCLSTNHGAFFITDGYCGEHRPFLKVALFLPAWLSKQYVLSKLSCEIAVSENDAHVLRRWYPFMRHKIRQIYHSRIHEGSAAPVKTERRKVILCVGTVGPRKGQWILTDAFARIAAKHPEWQLVLIGRMGDDPLSQRIRDTIAREKIGGQVQLLGTRSDQEVMNWLGEAAIFCMPSFQEGLGLSLQEALYYGCACVGSRIGGIPNLIDEGENGFLTEPGNVEELSANLERIISDDSLRGRISARARDSVLEKDMTAERMVSKYQGLYRELMNGAHP